MSCIRAFALYRSRWPWMILNFVIALILRFSPNSYNYSLKCYQWQPFMFVIAPFHVILCVYVVYIAFSCNFHELYLCLCFILVVFYIVYHCNQSSLMATRSVLGYEWLVRNNCVWLFGAHRVTINGVSVQLCTRSIKPSVRRIYARESISVPADMVLEC